MCAINVHPTSSALVPIAPYKGLQGCLRPGECLTPSHAKIHHPTIVVAVVPHQQEEAHTRHSLHSNASTMQLTTLATIRVIN